MSPRLTGPIEEHDWPEKLTAHVVTSDEQRIHGYSVVDDLVRHYGFAEVSFLSLVGELPDDATGRAVDGLLTLLAPVSAGTAAVHAGIVARLQGATPSAVASVAALGLGELAEQTVHEHGALFGWLDADRPGAPPPQYRCDDSSEQARVHEALAALGLPNELGHGLNYTAALLAGLHYCGLSPEQIQACLIVARLPVAIAEALAVRPGSFRDYPMRLPELVYEENR